MFVISPEDQERFFFYIKKKTVILGLNIEGSASFFFFAYCINPIQGNLDHTWIAEEVVAAGAGPFR